MTNHKRYYLLHGNILDREFGTICGAMFRANELMTEHGSRHSEIKIGDRSIDDDNNVVMIYYRQGEYPVRRS